MNSGLRSLTRLGTASGVLLLVSCAAPETASHQDASSEGALVATTRVSDGPGTAVEVAGDPEGIVRRNGRYYYLKDLRTTLLTGRQRLGGGLYFESNGEVTLPDGRRVRLLDGEMVTRGGEVREAPPYVLFQTSSPPTAPRSRRAARSALRG